MPQSLAKNYVHIIFSTKNRQPLIYPRVEGKLHGYLGGICSDLDCTPLKIGGYIDHVHILCSLSKKITLVRLLEEVKRGSSKWMKTQDELLQYFYWQDGYGAFSVSPHHVDMVSEYIANQHIHHQKQTYQEEYRAFLKKCKLEYDERYIWD